MNGMLNMKQEVQKFYKIFLQYSEPNLPCHCQGIKHPMGNLADTKVAALRTMPPGYLDEVYPKGAAFII